MTLYQMVTTNLIFEKLMLRIVSGTIKFMSKVMEEHCKDTFYIKRCTQYEEQLNANKNYNEIFLLLL